MSEGGRLVVIGSTGFIGRNIIAALGKDRRLNVSGLSSKDADLTKPSSASSLKKRITPGSAIIVSAAVTRDKGDNPEGLLANIKMAVNLARQVAPLRLSHLVYISTVDVYGRENIELPLGEGSRVQPGGYYAISKYASELILKKACLDSGTPYTVLRLPGVYGPGDTHKSPIKVFMAAAANGSRLNVAGDGSQLRDFLFVGDIPKVVRHILLECITGTYNIVAGKSYSINRILKTIEGLSGRRIEKVYGGRQDIDLVFRGSALLKKLPGFRFTGLRDGLAKTYGSYDKGGKRKRGKRR